MSYAITAFAVASSIFLSRLHLPEDSPKRGYFVLDYDSRSLLFYLTKSAFFLRIYGIVRRRLEISKKYTDNKREVNPHVWQRVFCRARIVSWNGFERIAAREAVMPRRLQALMQGRRKKTSFDFAENLWTISKP